MAGTIEGGLKAAQTNKERYPGFYQTIGRAGGKKSTGGGFASSSIGRDGLTGPQRASVVGKRGGEISKRKPL